MSLPGPGEVVAHVDGASRGNPGPASYGIFVVPAPGQPPRGGWGFLGVATNNVAEYTALVKLLAWAKEGGAERLDVRSDSELLVRQMEGRYKVKSPGLIPLYNEARQLAAALRFFRIRHVFREQNREADRLANHALDTRSDSSIVLLEGVVPGWSAAAETR